MHENIDAKVEKNKSDYQKINHQLLTLVESHKSENQKIKVFEETLHATSQQIETLTVKINQIDPNKITKLKDEKKSLLKQQDGLQKEVKHELIKKFYAEHKNIFDDFKMNPDVIANAYLFVQYLKNTGKILNEEVKNIQLQVKHQSDTLKDYEEQLKNMNAKIKLLDKDVDQQATFDCSKIKTNCPFIKVINKKTFEQLDKQKELLQKEKDALEAKIETLKKSKDSSKELKSKEKDIEDIKLVLHDIDRKEIEKIYDEAQEFQAKEKSIDTQITNLE
jgi:chromosome segregation ATPase